MAEMQRGGHADPVGTEDDDRVPLFGTWRTIYTAVAVTAVVVMGLLALFSGWPW